MANKKSDVNTKYIQPVEKIISQPDYGVKMDPIRMQPDYGVKMEPIIAQPDYGVKVEPIRLQPDYGVKMDPIVAQPDYGVRVTPIAGQPDYGVKPVARKDIDITYSIIEENIATLKKTINSLKTSWASESKKNISRLQNSWVGADCEAYTKKLSKMDTKVSKTISALELLCSTYEKARDMLKDTQGKTTSAINNSN